MKVLFLGIFQSMNGARSVTERNLNKVIDFFGEDNVHIIALIDEDSEFERLKYKYKNIYIYKSYKNKFQKLKNLMSGYYPLINKKIESNIINMVKTVDINKVYIDSAILGGISKKIKNIDSEIKIITFFHDINVHLMNNYQKDYKLDIKSKFEYLKRLPFFQVSILNEKRALKYSDNLVVLNKRDYKVLNKNYSVNVSTEIIPISFEDRFINDRCITGRNNKIKILFVGIAKHLPNVSGLIWFINNVLEHIDCELVIVGRGMEYIKDQIYTKNSYIDQKINLVGTVDDIDEYYYNADLVIVPIFEGGGMKVKTAEALMFGKVILSTSEGFEGYEIDGAQCYICNDKNMFIKTISNIYKDQKFNRFSQINRDLFINKYSNEVVQLKFEKCFN